MNWINNKTIHYMLIKRRKKRDDVEFFDRNLYFFIILSYKTLYLNLHLR